jgi:hypothetical protein
MASFFYALFQKRNGADNWLLPKVYKNFVRKPVLGRQPILTGVKTD